MADARIESVTLRRAVGEGRRGFTLVELLVVIGIIALLISILLPALSKARRSAQVVACLSNLKQMGLGAQSYFNEYKGAFPVRFTRNPNGTINYDSWFAANAISQQVDGKWPDPNFSGYENPPGSGSWVIVNPVNGLLNNVFICPGRVSFPSDPEVHMTRWSYAFNNSAWGFSLQTGGLPGLRVNQVVQPATKVYAMDWSGQSLGYGFNGASSDQPYGFVLAAGANGVQMASGANVAPYPPDYDYTECWLEFRQGRHGTYGKDSTVNVLYVDGHAENIPAKDAVIDFHFPSRPTPSVTPTIRNAPHNMFVLTVP